MKSGPLDLLEAGNSVMADRGFTITDLLEMKGVTLNIPLMKVNDQLSETDDYHKKNRCFAHSCRMCN